MKLIFAALEETYHAAALPVLGEPASWLLSGPLSLSDRAHFRADARDTGLFHVTLDLDGVAIASAVGIDPVFALIAG